MAGNYTDIRRDHWTLRVAPMSWRPYLRLARIDRPIGTWLLLWPCWWSLALASPGLPGPGLLIGFAFGALVMRGAGCCWNDIADRDLDGQVERTASRPIPAGEVSVLSAGIFMVALALCGLVILLGFNIFAILVGLMALAPVVIYPFMKRVTFWPQFFLGLAFNWGALLGWAAVRGELGLAPILLYGAGVAWTLGYDTIYAHQDKEDDARIGVKSTALKFGANSKYWLALFYTAAIALFAAAGAASQAGHWYYVGLGLVALHLLWQIWRWRPDDQLDCLHKFQSNSWLGWILFGAILFDHALT